MAKEDKSNDRMSIVDSNANATATEGFEEDGRGQGIAKEREKSGVFIARFNCSVDAL